MVIYIAWAFISGRYVKKSLSDCRIGLVSYVKDHLLRPILNVGVSFFRSDKTGDKYRT